VIESLAEPGPTVQRLAYSGSVPLSGDIAEHPRQALRLLAGAVSLTPEPDPAIVGAVDSGPTDSGPQTSTLSSQGDHLREQMPGPLELEAQCPAQPQLILHVSAQLAHRCAPAGHGAATSRSRSGMNGHRPPCSKSRNGEVGSDAQTPVSRRGVYRSGENVTAGDDRGRR